MWWCYFQLPQLHFSSRNERPFLIHSLCSEPSLFLSSFLRLIPSMSCSLSDPQEVKPSDPPEWSGSHTGTDAHVFQSRLFLPACPFDSAFCSGRKSYLFVLVCVLMGETVNRTGVEEATGLQCCTN